MLETPWGQLTRALTGGGFSSLHSFQEVGLCVLESPSLCERWLRQRVKVAGACSWGAATACGWGHVGCSGHLCSWPVALFWAQQWGKGRTGAGTSGLPNRVGRGVTGSLLPGQLASS